MSGCLTMVYFLIRRLGNHTYFKIVLVCDVCLVYVLALSRMCGKSAAVLQGLGPCYLLRGVLHRGQELLPDR